MSKLAASMTPQATAFPSDAIRGESRPTKKNGIAPSPLMAAMIVVSRNTPPTVTPFPSGGPISTMTLASPTAPLWDPPTRLGVASSFTGQSPRPLHSASWFRRRHQISLLSTSRAAT